MNIKYLNFSQASAISEDYQQLIGKPFDKVAGSSDLVVQQVVIAPYSRILQWQFIRMLQRGIALEDALKICPNGRFDVLVLPNIVVHPTLGFNVMPLREFLLAHDLPFKPERYNDLRAS